MQLNGHIETECSQKIPLNAAIENSNLLIQQWALGIVYNWTLIKMHFQLVFIRANISTNKFEIA